jgi:hypothetical protein
MLRRYWPPTSNSALVIWPSEQQRTASISTSNTFLFSITACFRRAYARYPGSLTPEFGQIMGALLEKQPFPASICPPTAGSS